MSSVRLEYRVSRCCRASGSCSWRKAPHRGRLSLEADPQLVCMCCHLQAARLTDVAVAMGHVILYESFRSRELLPASEIAVWLTWGQHCFASASIWKLMVMRAVWQAQLHLPLLPPGRALGLLQRLQGRVESHCQCLHLLSLLLCQKRLCLFMTHLQCFHHLFAHLPAQLHQVTARLA